jgi:Cu/Ag efflux protein CusF
MTVRRRIAGAGDSARAAGRRRAWVSGLLGLLLLLGGAPSCRKGETPSPAGSSQARRYTVRGEVVRLPDPAGPSSELLVRHEAIDDFSDSSGKVVGMPSMVMPFRAGSPALVQGLSVGDKIEFRFKVEWSGPSLDLELVKKLPATTVLRFGPATAARPGRRP